MLAWIALLFLIVVEVIGIKWWLASQLYRLFFNDWAAFLYSVLLAADVLVGWLISTLYQPGGTVGMQILLAITVGLMVIIGLASLFFQWVIRLDMTDISKKDK